jgi:hypothetical protein
MSIQPQSCEQVSEKKFSAVVMDPSGAVVQGYIVYLYEEGNSLALWGITREDGSTQLEVK